jgi:hypothetical protein
MRRKTRETSSKRASSRPRPRSQGFLDASKAAGVASGVLSDWHHMVVGLNLDDIGAGDALTTPMLDY